MHHVEVVVVHVVLLHMRWERAATTHMNHHSTPQEKLARISVLAWHVYILVNHQHTVPGMQN